MEVGPSFEDRRRFADGPPEVLDLLIRPLEFRLEFVGSFRKDRHRGEQLECPAHGVLPFGFGQICCGGILKVKDDIFIDQQRFRNLLLTGTAQRS